MKNPEKSDEIQRNPEKLLHSPGAGAGFDPMLVRLIACDATSPPDAVWPACAFLVPGRCKQPRKSIKIARNLNKYTEFAILLPRAPGEIRKISTNPEKSGKNPVKSGEIRRNPKKSAKIRSTRSTRRNPEKSGEIRRNHQKS